MVLAVVQGPATQEAQMVALAQVVRATLAVVQRLVQVAVVAGPVVLVERQLPGAGLPI